MTSDFNKIISIIDERIDGLKKDIDELEEQHSCLFNQYLGAHDELLYLREVLFEEIEGDRHD